MRNYPSGAGDGIVGPAEQLKLVEAIRAWFDQRFQKTPAYTVACASDKKPPRIPVVPLVPGKDDLEGGQPFSLIAP